MPTQVTVINTFSSSTETVTTSNNYTAATIQDVSLVNLATFYVKNTGGSNTAKVKFELSPDTVDWYTEYETTVDSGGAKIFVPTYFLRYTRASYKSNSTDQPTTLKIVFQTQS